LRIALVTGEQGAMVDAIAERVGVECVISGAKDKRLGIQQLCERLAVQPRQVCFVGDANRDALAFQDVGLALTPKDGSTHALAKAHRVLPSAGGEGAVADAVELLLQAKASVSERARAERRLFEIVQQGLAAQQRLLERSLPELAEIATLLISCFRRGGKLLLCGNGGSAADAQHVAAELVGRFALERAPISAIALTTDSSILTAVGNDWEFNEVFARQVRALARPGDVVVGISSSGRSQNVVRALTAARERGAHTLGFVGQHGGPIAELCELSFHAPHDCTPRIQELHLLAWHGICEIVEAALANGETTAEPAS
jgi:D-sedoheptulose 7-phosphate isomerase